MGGLCARELQGKLIVRVRTTDEDISDESFTTKAEILINLMTKKNRNSQQFEINGLTVKT